MTLSRPIFRLSWRVWFFFLSLFLALEVLFILTKAPSDAALSDYSRQLFRLDSGDTNITRALLFVTLVEKVFFFISFPKNLQAANLFLSWAAVFFFYRLHAYRFGMGFAKFFFVFKGITLVVSPSLFMTSYGIGREGLSVALIIAIFAISMKPFGFVAKSSLIAALTYVIYSLRDVDIIAAFLAAFIGFGIERKTNGYLQLSILLLVSAGLTLFLIVFVFLSFQPANFLAALDSYAEGGSSYMIGDIRSLTDVLLYSIALALAFGFFVPSLLWTDSLAISAVTLLGMIQFLTLLIYLLYSRSKFLIAVSFLCFNSFFAYGVFVRNYGSALRWSTAVDIVIVLTLLYFATKARGTADDR